MACDCHSFDPRLDAALGKIEANKLDLTTLLGKVKVAAPSMYDQLRPHVTPLLQKQGEAAELCRQMGGGSYKGDFKAEELAGVIWLPNSQFATVKIKAGPLGDVLPAMGQDASKFSIFHLGKGDPGRTYGYGDATLTDRETSFLQGGDLPQGWLFDGRGFEVYVRSTDGTPLQQSDMQIIGEWQLRYTEEGATRALRLGPVRRMPPAHRIETWGDDELTCGQFIGPSWRSSGPVFRIRGGDKEKRAIEVFVDPKTTLKNDVIITFSAVGLEGQRPQVS